MQKRTKSEKPTLFEKAVNSLGWAWYSLKLKVSSLFPKREKIAKLGAKRRKDAFFVYGMLLLPLIQFGIFYIGVNINSILMTFQRYVDGEYQWAGFYNFEFVWKDFISQDIFGSVVKNSVLSFVIVQLMSPLILFATYFIYRKFVGYRFFKIMLFLPTIISIVITVTIYKKVCDVAIPAIWSNLFHKSIRGLLSNPDTRYGAVMFFYLWLSFGSLMLMYLGAMNGISDSISEAARLDGASNIQEFIYIVFPMIYPTFSTLFYTSVATIFTNQINLYSLWGISAPPAVMTFGYYLYREVSMAGEARYPGLATLGVMMTLVAAPLTFFFKWLLQKLGPKVN